MIADFFIGIINSLITTLVDAVNALMVHIPLPSIPASAFSWLKSLDAFLPVSEFVTGVVFLIGYFSVLVVIKWIVKLIDWLPVT